MLTKDLVYFYCFLLLHKRKTNTFFQNTPIPCVSSFWFLEIPVLCKSRIRFSLNLKRAIQSSAQLETSLRKYALHGEQVYFFYLWKPEFLQFGYRATQIWMKLIKYSRLWNKRTPWNIRSPPSKNFLHHDFNTFLHQSRHCHHS